jgi:uncharacterized phage protein (TIGR02218 family)
MRSFDQALAASLATETTTLCRCWRLQRRDGIVLGFTDHDVAIAFDGVTFEPDSGLTRTALERSLGLSLDNMEAAGALRSDAISEADLARGLYDGAALQQWVVDWSDARSRDLSFAGVVGEVRRGALGFEVDVSGLADVLNLPQGRVFLRGCDAALGDARCGVALTGAMRGAGSVSDVRGERGFVVAGLSAAEGWFSLGRLTWTGGDNAGESVAVHAHAIRQFKHVITLWRAPNAPIEAGDAFDIVAGCDKSAETCRAKFANIVNFRGFAHMPGEDWSAGYPAQGEVHDGGSLFRG